MCFLWSMNCICVFCNFAWIKYLCSFSNFIWSYYWAPLWSSGQRSWLRIQRSGFDSRLCQTFWELVNQERDPLSLVSTIEELLGRNSSGSGLESREYSRRDPLSLPRDTLYAQNLALNLPTSSGRSVGVVRSRTKITELLLLLLLVVVVVVVVVFNTLL
jgi:hypothetical protein